MSPRRMAQLPDYFKSLLPEDAIWRHDHVYHRYTTRCIDGIIKPFRQLQLCPEEVSFLKLIILLTKMPNGDASRILSDAMELKERIIKAMFQFYRSSGVQNAEGRFAEILLLLSSISAVAMVHAELYQFIRVFNVFEFDELARNLLFDE